jgi:hypothetical protein
MKDAFPVSCLAALLMLTALAPLAAADTAEASPELRLTASGAFEGTSPRAGDTVRYRVRVEWEDVPAAVMLLPMARLETPGFLPAGGSVFHSKTVSGGKSRNVTEYDYALVAREPGTARVASFALRYRNGLTGRDESVNVPGASLEIAPARVSLMRGPFAWILAALVLAVAAWIGFRIFRARKQARRDAPPPESPIDAEIAALRARCEVADSREWTADAERLCTRFLCDRLGISRPENVRFEAALDQYLARGRGVDPAAESAWASLRDFFHEARYAGARREPYVLLEACRHLKTCLHPNEGTPHVQPISA